MTIPDQLAPPGAAGARVAEFGPRARLRDLYGPEGASVYHDMSAGDTAETREIVRRVRAVPGPVLDLAAGSGRITLPILALGRAVTALDLSADMLALLAERLGTAPARLRDRCTLVQADMSGFRLADRFAAVVLGATSASLLDADGRAGLFSAVAAHLAPGGRFLTTALTRGDAGGAGTGAETEHVVRGASGTAYRLHEYWPEDADQRVITVLPAEPEPAGAVEVFVARVAVLPADRLAGELARAGLAVGDRTEWADPGRHHITLLEAEAAR